MNQINRNSYRKDIGYLLLLNILFVFYRIIISCATLAFQAGEEIAKLWYPRFYKWLIIIGEHTRYIEQSVWSFSATITVLLLLNFYLLYRIIAKLKDTATARLFCAIFLISIVIAEIVLRGVGYKPGMHTYSQWFTPVDTLIERSGFFADENGIFKVDSCARLAIMDRIHKNNPTVSAQEAHDVYSLASDYIQLLDRTAKNSLSQLYFTIQQTSPENWTDWDSAVVSYVHSPINTSGFRSIEFKKYQGKKIAVLLLGDSFTWGHSAENKTNSFADVLLSMGYVVYNAGITGTDVAQYLAVARKYISELQPDFVIVNFYIGNDITYYKRDVLPNQPVFYSTNAGHLIACPHGKYFETKEDAYNFLYAQTCIPKNVNSFNYWSSQFAISTLFWNALSREGIITYQNSLVGKYYNEAEKRKYAEPYCNLELQEIKRITEENNAQFILSSSPNVSYASKQQAQDYPDLFKGLKYAEMQVLNENYNLNDAHFNDEGHKQYAIFLDSLIRNY